ncbi:CHAT domain-containing protein [Streptomyces venezuelae]|uniref:CHAT domain-containing protein n=1 Tax=Streptomyces venezuelae TaxID=54571 RepID=UPI00123874A2|nr:CHAT domain-containing protein [Streptomyces venezuelae]QES04175.1 CHAT domain-containing protein [Streptomyces venezuelae]
MRLPGGERLRRYEDIQAGPTDLHDRRWRVVRLAAATAPLGTVVGSGRLDLGPASDRLGLLLAVLLLVRAGIGERRMRAISRAARRVRCRGEAAFLAAGTGLAALLPTGGATPHLGEVVLCAVVASAVTVLGCLAEFRAWPQVRGVSPLLVRFFGRLRTWFCYGWIPSLVAVVHPDAVLLLPAATAMTVLEICFAVLAMRTGDWALRADGAIEVLTTRIARDRFPLGLYAIARERWWETAARPPHRPDMALWELWLRHGELLSSRKGYGLVPVLWRPVTAVPASQAEPWISAAEASAESLRWLCHQRIGLDRARHRELSTTSRIVTAMTAMARAEASCSSGEFDYALRNRRHAAELYASAGLAGNAAAARCLAADVLVFDLRRPEEAVRELEAIAARPTPPRAVACLALVLKAVAGDSAAGRQAARMMPLDLRSAAGLFDELPTWLPFGSHHHQEIAFVRWVEQRFAAMARTLGPGLPAQARARSMYTTFLDRYEMPAAHDLRQALQRAGEYEEGRSPVAREIAEEVAAAARSVGDLPNEAEARRLLARLAEAEHRWADLTAELLAVVDLVERMRERVSDGDTRIDVDLTPACARLIELVVDGRPSCPTPAQAVELAERSRSRLLLEVFGSTVSPELPQHLEELREREARMEQGRVREGVLPRPGGTDFAHRDIHPAHQRRYRAAREAVWAELEASGPLGAAYVRHRRGAPAGFEELRAVLPPGVVLFELVRRGPRMLVLVVRADRPEPAVFAVPLVEDPDLPRLPAPGGPTRWGQSLWPLARAVAQHSAPGETVWLVPDGPLHDLPLHAVEVDGAPLGERNPLCVTPSASLLRHRLGQAAEAGVRRALIMADPDGDLPHARAEAHLIGGLLPHTEVHTGGAATRRRLLDELGSETYDVLHLACHYIVDRARPAGSAVRLADGRLTVEDFLSVRLDASLVVVSGCETGAQQNRRGNELIGLTRALLHAGARAVIVSQWAVNDVSTALLMAGLYQGLGRGTPVAAALSAARSDLRTMSFRDAVARCERLRNLPANRPIAARLGHDLAQLRLRAGDSAGALAEIEKLLPGAGHGTAEHQALAALRRQARFQHGRLRADYARPAFDAPFFWAPFTLVGDWR